ncbi:MAG: hypothetical protein A2498_01790 [Lentisphaerae bacterium RIFOXYC12_FULL_60_16]|nr:MAG: hypothetical protein A2498_01790 [Lentisphaerae bacterium RIFOXYC12_FULL_60_16]
MVKKQTGCPIFDNAVDSLEHGLRLYQDGNYPNAHKHAILAVYQAVELFLKDALYRINPVLIYADIDKQVRDDSRTVGFKDAVVRLENLNVHIATESKQSIERLQKRRNVIEHLEYKPSDNDRSRMADAIKVLYDFVPQYLKDGELADYIDDDLWRELQVFILDYEKLVAEAQTQVDELTTVPPGDYGPEVVECPQCGNATLVIGGRNSGDYCFFCRRTLPMAQCCDCSEYYPAEMLKEVSRCPDCMWAQGEKG